MCFTSSSQQIIKLEILVGNQMSSDQDGFSICHKKIVIFTSVYYLIVFKISM